HTYNVTKVYSTTDELVHDPEVEIVDTAVYPWETIAVAEQAIRAGKHALCQKPLCDEYTKAARFVEMAETSNLKLAVNQQMRWTVAVSGTKQLIDHGWLGMPTYATIQVHCLTDWSMWPWMYSQTRLEALNDSIHYIDF